MKQSSTILDMNRYAGLTCEASHSHPHPSLLGHEMHPIHTLHPAMPAHLTRPLAASPWSNTKNYKKVSAQNSVSMMQFFYLKNMTTNNFIFNKILTSQNSSISTLEKLERCQIWQNVEWMILHWMKQLIYRSDFAKIKYFCLSSY